MATSSESCNGANGKGVQRPCSSYYPRVVPKSAGTPREKAHEVPKQFFDHGHQGNKLWTRTMSEWQLRPRQRTHNFSTPATTGYLLQQILTRVVPDCAMVRGKMHALTGPTYYPELSVR
ncbi:hypothetical protein Zmor_021428 [Zophobas morio]|uniref:Uncharacterized protein n=1 Tax=Zophobas morio TaxID=2755281 RepID=A0AA38MAT1_9CUCU|nr:hypothetical protein Zmor_021428 [Zophobas morio]